MENNMNIEQFAAIVEKQSAQIAQQAREILELRDKNADLQGRLDDINFKRDIARDKEEAIEVARANAMYQGFKEAVCLFKKPAHCWEKDESRTSRY